MVERCGSTIELCKQIDQEQAENPDHDLELNDD
jgi:dsRNA-specific ribonuclease